MSEDDDTHWCECEYEQACYGGSKILHIMCKILSKLGRVPFLKEVDEEDEE